MFNDDFTPHGTFVSDEYVTYIAHEIEEMELAAATDEDFISEVAEMIAYEVQRAREMGYRDGIASLLQGD